MKLFDAGAWGEILQALPTWSALSLEARRTLLDVLKPSGSVAASVFGEHLDELLRSGLVVREGTRARVAEEHRSLLKALRGMDRHRRLLETPTREALTRYLEEHFTAEELQPIERGSGYGYGYVNRKFVAQIVASADWIEEFLETRGKQQMATWEKGRLGPGEPRLFGAAEIQETAQALLRRLLPHPEGVPLRELMQGVRVAGLPVLADALHALLRYLLAYAVLRDADLEPVIGAWPPAARHLLRPPPEPPAAVTPQESFHSAFLMEDMTAVLVAAVGEPLRLRGNDYQVFARTEQAIATRLISIPAWVLETLGLDYGDEEDDEERTEKQNRGGRVQYAAAMLRTLDFAKATGDPGQNLRLQATRKGTQWLTLSERDRLKALLDRLRNSEQRNPPGGWYQTSAGWDFFPSRLNFELPKDRIDLRAAMTEAFLSLPPEGYVRLESFLEYQRREHNPLLAAREALEPRIRGYGGSRRLAREDWERLWGELLELFLALRLAMLGGVRLGRMREEGEACFSLTGAGRYLLGAAKDFEYGHAGDAEVIVQPNFEVVFLAPSAQVEAQLTRFADRVGAGPGVMFRITRGSILGAAETGMTLEQLLGTLERVSSKDLPANVERQIRDWFAAVRRIAIRPSVLLECPDAETASRVLSAGGKNVRPITETLLELRDSTSQTRKALLKQLRAAGIFLEV